MGAALSPSWRNRLQIVAENPDGDGELAISLIRERCGTRMQRVHHRLLHDQAKKAHQHPDHQSPRIVAACPRICGSWMPVVEGVVDGTSGTIDVT